MYPICETVDQASTRLMSSLAQPMIAPIIRVNAPIATTTVCAVALAEKIGLDRAMRYTPAVTIVAAWISAETGVGPSIASGNQACSGNWPDLPHAEQKQQAEHQYRRRTGPADVAEHVGEVHRAERGEHQEHRGEQAGVTDPVHD